MAVLCTGASGNPLLRTAFRTYVSETRFSGQYFAFARRKNFIARHWLLFLLCDC